MTDLDYFQYFLIGLAGLMILAAIVAYARSTSQRTQDEAFLERAANSPLEQVRAWIEQYETEVDFVPYTATVLHVRIEGDPEIKSFAYPELEWACEALLRSGVPIENPTWVVDKVRKHITGKTKRRTGGEAQ